MIIRCLLFVICATIAAASYCGQSAIPFTFQNLRSGHPVLGCARPRCFGWTKNGTRAEDSAQFYRINGKEDGYLRRSDLLLKAPAASSYLPQTSTCSDQYSTEGCAEGQWVGGIAPLANSYHRQLQVRCCSYAPLLTTEDKGVAPIKQGQVFIGGEVLEGNKLVAFDYISDIKKEVFDDGTIQYAVAVRRMQCTEESDLEIEPVVSRNAEVKYRDGVAKGPEIRPLRTAPVTDHQLQNIAQGVATQTEYAPVNTGFGQALQSNIVESEASIAAQQQQFNQNQRHLQPTAPVSPPVFSQGLPVVQQGVAIAAPGQNTQQVNYQQQNVAYQQQQTQNAYPQQQQNAGYGEAQQQQNYGNQYQHGYGVQTQQAYGNQNYQQGYGQQLQQPNQGQPIMPTQPAPTQIPDGNKMLGDLLPMQLMNGQPLPTLPPLNLEQLPKLDIPSVEDVENVIPPLQKSILTNIAKFFGVL